MTTDTDYTKLSRQQKLAVFLIVIGPESAAEVLRQFDDTEIEGLCREMATYTIISSAMQKLALEEFSALVAQSAGSAIGGIGYAQRTLEIAKGDYKASAIIERVGPLPTSVDVISEIAEMEGRQIFSLIKDEQPQTICFLLSYLDGAKSAEVFALLSPDVREEVAERLGSLESTSLELVGKIVKSLGKHCHARARVSMHRSGGVRSVADLLKKLDKESSKMLLAKLEARNVVLGAAIRKRLFSFEDIIRLQPAELQRVLREVDSANLALSMKSASEPLRVKIYGSISKRAAESLKEEVEMLGSVRVKDVEVAQDAIIQCVRRLEEEGQVSLDAEGAGGFVS